MRLILTQVITLFSADGAGTQKFENAVSTMTHRACGGLPRDIVAVSGSLISAINLSKGGVAQQMLSIWIGFRGK